MVFIFNGKEIERSFCLNYFDLIEENGRKICLIYVNFFEENDVEKVIKNNYDFIFRVIRECISCNFYNIEVYLSMICVDVKIFGDIEVFLDSRCILFLNKKDR